MENKIKPKWVITPYREKDEKSEDIELQLTEFNNFQDILDFSEIYYIFGKYNGYRKLYNNLYIDDPFNVTHEQKSELGKSQNELKNNLEQNDKVLKYLIVFRALVESHNQEIPIDISRSEIRRIRHYIVETLNKVVDSEEIKTGEQKVAVKIFDNRIIYFLDHESHPRDRVYLSLMMELFIFFIYYEKYESDPLDHFYGFDFEKNFNNLQDELQRNILQGRAVDKIRRVIISVIEKTFSSLFASAQNIDLLFSLESPLIGVLYFHGLINTDSLRKQVANNRQLNDLFKKLDEKFKSSEERNRKCFAILSEINQSDVKLFISGPKEDEQNFEAYIDKFINEELKIEYLQYNDYSDTDYSPYILACDKKCCMQDRDFSNFENYFKSTYNLADLPPHFNGYNQAIYCTEKKVVSYIDKENLNGKYSLYVRFKRCCSCKLILSNKESFNYKKKVTLFVHDKGQTRGVNDKQMQSISALMYLFKDFLDNHRDREKSDKKFRSYRRICKR